MEYPEIAFSSEAGKMSVVYQNDNVVKKDLDDLSDSEPEDGKHHVVFDG